MAVDKRTDQLMAHVEAMLEIIDDMNQDMQSRIEEENASDAPNDSRINFYTSQQRRLVKLTDLLEEDILEVLISIRNISGPIEYFEN
ncbi:MAG TPA: hypothetical protein PLL88_00655 [Anaerolineaceae bacterium]|jgi:hypothetical protein|nr:hypothetical protein [Anaerolineaceae bacterium]